MTNWKRSAFKRVALFVLTLSLVAGSHWSAWALLISVEAPPILSITDDTGSFSLSFQDFFDESLSSTQQVTYRIQASNMTPGAVQGVVTAHLVEVFEGIALEGQVDSYTNAGNANFATLEKVQPGFLPIQTTQTALADKQPGLGPEDICLDGHLRITWRAQATQDISAGSRTQFLIVTLKEGN